MGFREVQLPRVLITKGDQDFRKQIFVTDQALADRSLPIEHPGNRADTKVPLRLRLAYLIRSWR
ncbi:MAG: hypothetical protein ACK53L_18540 [Pirellulaceae bacterium]